MRRRRIREASVHNQTRHAHKGASPTKKKKTKNEKLRLPFLWKKKSYCESNVQAYLFANTLDELISYSKFTELHALLALLETFFWLLLLSSNRELPDEEATWFLMSSFKEIYMTFPYQANVSLHKSLSICVYSLFLLIPCFFFSLSLTVTKRQDDLEHSLIWQVNVPPFSPLFLCYKQAEPQAGCAYKTKPILIATVYKTHTHTHIYIQPLSGPSHKKKKKKEKK